MAQEMQSIRGRHPRGLIGTWPCEPPPFWWGGADWGDPPIRLRGADPVVFISPPGYLLGADSWGSCPPPPGAWALTRSTLQLGGSASPTRKPPCRCGVQGKVSPSSKERGPLPEALGNCRGSGQSMGRHEIPGIWPGRRGGTDGQGARVPLPVCRASGHELPSAHSQWARHSCGVLGSTAAGCCLRSTWAAQPMGSCPITPAGVHGRWACAPGAFGRSARPVGQCPTYASPGAHGQGACASRAIGGCTANGLVPPLA